jgi:hypothetical protein
VPRRVRKNALGLEDVPARVVMEILGHSTTALTMNTYSHLALTQSDGRFVSPTTPLSLPIPGKEGPATYDDSYLIFDRADSGPGELQLFQLTVTDSSALNARRQASRNAIDLNMTRGGHTVCSFSHHCSSFRNQQHLGVRPALPGFMLGRWEYGPLLQFARLALVVAAPGRCGGLRGRLARRRRRGPEGLRAACGAQARNGS